MLSLLSYLVVRAVAITIAYTPARLAGTLGAAGGSLLFHVVRMRRAIVLANLAYVFPEKSEAERLSIARESYRTFGRAFTELLRAGERGLAGAGYDVRLSEEDERELRRLRETHTGLLISSLHLDNFDFTAGAICGRGFPMIVLMKPLKNERVNAYLVGVRERAGMQIAYPGRPGLPAHLTPWVAERVKAGAIAGMLPDQNARQKGTPVRFLGRPASFYPGFGRLAVATGMPQALIWFDRDAEDPCRAHVRFRFLPPAPPPGPGEDAEAAAAAALQRLADVMGQVIRARPGRYFWFHRLFGSAPLRETSAAPPPSTPPA